jgi:hypothetical protein
MAFYPGCAVVCVDDYFKDSESRGEIFPIKGQTYTIRDVPVFNGDRYLWLDEIRNDPDDYAEGVFEYAFHPARFRPVVKRELPESLTRLLSQPSQREVVHV